MLNGDGKVKEEKKHKAKSLSS